MRKSKLNYTDRLTLNGASYRFLEATSNGYLFVREDDDETTIALTAEQLREHLETPHADLERGYFEPGAGRLRIDCPSDRLQDLCSRTLSLVLWKLDWVETFLSMEQDGEICRTTSVVSSKLGDLRNRIDTLHTKKQSSLPGANRAGALIAHRKPPCVGSLLSWVRKYLKAGHNPRALIPEYYNSGNRKRRLSVAALEIVAKHVETYATIQRPTIKEIVRKCRRAFKAENERRGKDGISPLPIPSGRTIHRRIKGLDPYVTYARRYGAEAANRKFALIEEGTQSTYPMERVEIDAWNVDLLTLVDAIGATDFLSSSERERIGTMRLWLYVALDCATRCVVGMHLCDGETVDDAIKALYLVTRDKTKMAVAAGAESSWHQGGSFGTVVTDQGSAFLDDRFRSTVLDFRGVIGTPPAGVPRLRGRVERIFRTFSIMLMPKLSGRTYSNPKDRGDYPSEQLAVHTRETLMQILTIHVVDIYHNSPHRGLNGETPADCWERLCGKVGSLDFPSAFQRCCVFGTRVSRKVTNRGVRVFNIDYACDALREIYLRAPGSEVEIRVQPDDLGWIVVKVGQKSVVAHALQTCFDGVSLGQWRLASRELNLKYGQQAKLREAVVARALEKIEEINQAQMDAFDVRYPFLSAADLAREERQLHLGLSIDPAKVAKLNFPDADGLIGVEVPMPDVEPDLFNQPRSDWTDEDDHSDGEELHPKPRNFGLEDE